MIRTFQDWTALGSLILTAVGFVLVILQLRQIRATIHTAAHAAIYEHGGKFRDQLVAYPEFRPYLLDGAPVGAATKDISRLHSIAEIYLNYLEHLYLSQAGLGAANARSVDNALKESFRGAPVLRDVLESRTCAYSQPFREHVASLLKDPMPDCG